jgi:hypothetical protein
VKDNMMSRAEFRHELATQLAAGEGSVVAAVGERATAAAAEATATEAATAVATEAGAAVQAEVAAAAACEARLFGGMTAAVGVALRAVSDVLEQRDAS